MADKEIEEVKKICTKHRVCEYLFSNEVDKLAKEICRLFEARIEALTKHFNDLIKILEDEQEANTVATIGLVVSHIWQFARGTGYPLKWEISEADRMSVLKHYGVHYQGDNCPTCGGKCIATHTSNKEKTDNPQSLDELKVQPAREQTDKPPMIKLAKGEDPSLYTFKEGVLAQHRADAEYLEQVRAEVLKEVGEWLKGKVSFSVLDDFNEHFKSGTMPEKEE